jgi:hypothetical protein
VDSKNKGAWGPIASDETSEGMSVIFAAPYASTMDHIAVESVWSNGKNFVGSATNATAERTTATVIDMLHERWFGKDELEGF